MALAYPEGEVFFSRRGLVSPTYNAANESQFHSTLLVEYLWNRPAHSGDREVNHPHGRYHPRSDYVITRRLLRTRHGNYTHLPFTYSRTGDEINGLTRATRHELCTDTMTFDRWESGAGDEAWFMPMPMPSPQLNERWVWIDMLACIRSIYFPLSFRADENHPDLCIWVQINFAQRRTVQIRRGQGESQAWRTFELDTTTGLGVHPNLAIGFDVHGLIQLLSLPRQLRKANPYASELIKVTMNLRTFIPFGVHLKRNNIEWTTVAAANFGLDLQWKPAQRGTWFTTWLRNVITVAVRFIPVAGPFLAILFPLAWQLIVDPADAYDLLKELAPGWDLTDQMIRQILNSLDDTKQYLPTGWEQLALPQQSKPAVVNVNAEEEKAVKEPVKTLEEIGRSAAFTTAEAILEISGYHRAWAHRDDKDAPKPGDELGPGEGGIEKRNPATEIPEEKREETQ